MLYSIWKHCLNATNVILCFMSAGVFPVDKTVEIFTLDKQSSNCIMLAKENDHVMMLMEVPF